VNLPETVTAEGWAAAAASIRAIAEEAGSPKKAAKALDAAGLAELSLPSALRAGAELSLHDAGPLGRCTWDGTATCRLDAAGSGVTAADFRVQCRTSHGGTSPLTATPDPAAPAGRVGWLVTGVEACWDLDATGVDLVPVALGDLDGMGKGDDLIPPEIVELSQDQVQATIAEHQGAFQYCTRKFSADHVAQKGKLVVRYHIADDGHIDTATVESGTFTDPQIEACILEQFQRLKFPPTNGGFAGGTFPLTFL
jgi:hypothetical protein